MQEHWTIYIVIKKTRVQQSRPKKKKRKEKRNLHVYYVICLVNNLGVISEHTHLVPCCHDPLSLPLCSCFHCCPLLILSGKCHPGHQQAQLHWESPTVNMASLLQKVSKGGKNVKKILKYVFYILYMNINITWTRECLIYMFLIILANIKHEYFSLIQCECVFYTMHTNF